MRLRHGDGAPGGVCGPAGVTHPIALVDGRFVLPGNRWDLLAGIEPVHPPTVSVVVPYFEDQLRLDLLLAALSRQSHPRDRLEVIVADDGSCNSPRLDELRGVAGRIVRQENLGFRAGAARNLGVTDSTGEVVVFLDADTYPEPEYISRLVRLPALAPDVMVTGRRRHADFTGWAPEQLRRWFDGGLDGPPELTEPAWLCDEHRRSKNLLDIGENSYRYVISAVLACSRSLFEAAGGFDESLVGYGGEDWEFAYRALGRGALLAHVADAVAWHDGPDWAERGTSAGRRQQKAAETSALAARIPDFTEKLSNGRAHVIVELTIGEQNTREWVATVRSLLLAPVNLAIYLSGAGADGLRRTYFQFAKRVIVGPIDQTAGASARILVTIDQPTQLGPLVWSELREWFEDAGLGRVLVRTHSGTLVATATRAVGRVERWRDVVGDPKLFGRLFATVTI
ncbi:MAG: kfoC 2 [Pseudonocardiales bacterium]|nr:kfoC 2 [Pseudonocardiales bacterium]